MAKTHIPEIGSIKPKNIGMPELINEAMKKEEKRNKTKLIPNKNKPKILIPQQYKSDSMSILSIIFIEYHVPLIVKISASMKMGILRYVINGSNATTAKIKTNRIANKPVLEFINFRAVLFKSGCL